MWQKVSSFFQTVKETTEVIIWISGVVVVIGVVGAGFDRWFNSFSIFGKVCLLIIVAALLTIVVALVFNWLNKRAIEKIPDVVEKLDVLISNFVEDFRIELKPEEWTKLNQDYGSLLGIDLSGLEKALKEDANKKELERVFDSVSRTYNNKLNPELKTAETLADLGDMASILDSYNSGFERLKTTPQYQKLIKRIKSLQKKAPSAYISMKVNDYLITSERLYILILGTKPLYEQPLLSAKLPAKVKAKKSQIRPIVDSHISNLIAGIREAILKHKERNSEYKTVSFYFGLFIPHQIIYSLKSLWEVSLVK